jgi:putative transposase
MSTPAYLWRKLTDKQRDELMSWRKRQGLPWHRPPHRAGEHQRFHVTAACYEHAPHIGWRPERMIQFSELLVATLNQHETQVHAWCVLPNHYHALVETRRILEVLKSLAQMHGRTSFAWNKGEATRGRQVWCGAAERYMRNDGHFWATLNCVHHNPVHHGYATRWQEWPFSSAREYLEMMGREFAEQTWKEYPLLDYGQGWDDPSL